MGLGLFSGCGQGTEVNFEIGSASGHASEQPIKIIVRSLEEWNNSDAAKTITIDEKYDVAFFTNNALVVVAFRTTSGEGEIQEIKVSKSGNRLIIDIDGTDGLQTMIGVMVVAIEVKKDDIQGINNIKFTTNMKQPK